MSLLGMDLGSQFIKAVETKRTNDGKSELITTAKADISQLDVSFAKDMDVAVLTDFMRDFVLQNNFIGKPLNIGLPSPLTYIRIDAFPKLSGKELENAIKLELQNQTVIPLEDASVSFQVLPSNNSEKVDVLSVIAPKNLTNKLLKVVKDSGLNLESIEPSILGTIRGILDETQNNPPTIVLDLGYKYSDISVFAEGALRFTRNVTTGLSSIVKTVSQSLSLEMVQADEYVKAYGMSEEKLNGKVKEAASPVVTLLLDEVRRSITFYETRQGTTPVKRLVLTGGGSLIPGLVVHAANYLGLEVQLSDPWDRIDNLGQYTDRAEELESQATIYTTATGLSLKNIQNK